MTKKVKRTISLIIAAIMLLSTMSVLAFADHRLPTYGEATSKEVGPHDCVAGLETEDKAAYAQPTCTKAGSAEYVIKCTVCGKELSRRKVYLPKLDSHVAGEVTIEDVVAPTCKDFGSYNEVVRCKICNAVLSSTKVLVAKTTAHVAGVPQIDKSTLVNATCAEPGSYVSVIKCKICGKVLQTTFKEIPKLTYHVSEYSLNRRVFLDGTRAFVLFENNPGVYFGTKSDRNGDGLADWEEYNGVLCPVVDKSGNGIFDNGYYIAGGWFVNGKTRTCADGEERCAICGELLNPAIPHVWDKGVVTKKATITTPGEITYSCLIDGCSATKKVATPVKDNKLGDVDSDNEVTAADARLVLRYAVGLGNFDKVINDSNFKAADYDKNGKIEPADARMILRAAVQLPN